MRLFLDTSVQIDKWAADLPKKKRISDKLEQSESNRTSIYVLGEYNRSIGKDLATFLDLLSSSPTLGRALKRLPRYGRSTDRIVKHLLAPILEELETVGSFTVDQLKEKVRERAESIQVYVLDDLFFNEGIEDDVLVESPHCVDAESVPSPSGGISCPANASPPCDVEDFWEDHNTELQALAKNLTTRRKKMRELKSLINRIVKDETHVHGTNCFKLGDTIISIQTPEDYHIFTTNVQDFEPICQALGKPDPIVP